jgi:membrane dipeptidase
MTEPNRMRPMALPRRLIATLLATSALLGAGVADARPVSEREARAIHARMLTLDSHLDTPAVVARPGFDILARSDWRRDMSQVDVPRMRLGGLDGGFWVIYTQQGPRTEAGHAAARDHGLRRMAVIREMVAARPDVFGLALRADDAARIAASGRKVVFISMENSFPLGRDISLLKTFYDLGLRMAGPVHFLNNDLADSSTDRVEHGGLTELGRQFVREANRLGIIVDHSHASDAVFDQMLELSTAPIVLSHSGCDAVYDHARNIDDERLKALAAKGGVIQMNAFGAYLDAVPPASPERTAALAALREQYGPPQALAPERLAAYRAELGAINMRHPPPLVGFEAFMAHLLHAIRLIGVDHVGIGLDWDGGGGVEGMEDVSQVWRITQRLLDEGYSQADIEKIWSGNLLRVMRAVEAEAARQAASG